ncbi:MAG: M48 family metallopeptidase [Spirochaetia bacterium]|nr:M48 family metallopeptidase [Spirochaetia bacterium]
MDPGDIRLIYLIFFFLELGWGTFLSLLNIAQIHKNREKTPEWLAGLVEEDTYKRAVRYNLERCRFSLVSDVFSSFAILSLVFSGALGSLDALLRGLGLSAYPAGILFIFAVSLIFYFLSLPFSLYSHFVVEERHGFNKMTPALFAKDAVKGLALSALVSAPLLLALFWFMDTAGRLWWIIAFAFTAAFQLFISLVYPLVIAPLFNKFAPLAEGSLKEKISALAQKLSFGVKGIFVMDGSRRSHHSNAYFTGLGRAKRVVLFDTLLASLSEGEILAVLAHEIGHEKKKHLYKRLAASCALLFAAFGIVNILYRWEPLFAAFGFSAVSCQGIFVILGFCSGPFTFFLTPLFTAASRRHEYQADRYAGAAGFARELESALLRLGKDNLANLTPHPLYSFYHYSHPTLAERIAALRKAVVP